MYIVYNLNSSFYSCIYECVFTCNVFVLKMTIVFWEHAIYLCTKTFSRFIQWWLFWLSHKTTKIWRFNIRIEQGWNQQLLKLNTVISSYVYMKIFVPQPYRIAYIWSEIYWKYQIIKGIAPSPSFHTIIPVYAFFLLYTLIAFWNF